jgi:PAS domain S-box-containing protein
VNKKENSIRLVTVVLAVGLVLAAFFAERGNNEQHATIVRAAVQDQLGLIRARLEGNLQGNVQLVRGMVSVITLDPDLDQAKFERAIRPLFLGRSQLRNIGASPNMIIRMMYPLVGNKKAIGVDLRQLPEQFAAAERARTTRQIVLGGPQTLVQGGIGLITRLPVFIEDDKGQEQFWGLVSAVIDVDALYRESGLFAEDLPIEIAIRGKDASGPNGEVFFGRAGVFDDSPVLADIPLPSGSWRLAAIPRGGWPLQADNNAALRLGFLVVALMILVPFFALARATRLAGEARAQAESGKALIADSEDKFRSLFELSPVGIALNDQTTGRFIEVNDALLTALGYSREKLLTLSYTQITPTEYGAEDQEQIASIERVGRYGPFEKEYIRKNGSRFPVLLNGIRRVDASGRAVIWSIVEDISERKQAEESLRASEALFRSLIQASPLPIAVTHGANESVVVLNERFVATFGYASEDLPDVAHWWPLAYPDAEQREREKPHWEQLFATARRTGVAAAMETVITCRDGARKPVEVHLSVIDAFSVFVLGDLTQKKQAEAELVRAREAAEEANRAKSAFLASISHELRTPLNAVIGFAQMLDMDVPVPLHAEQKEAVGHILNGGRHLLALINEILDLARIESGRLDLAIVTVALDEAIAEAVELSQPLAARRGISLRHTAAAGIHVRADAARLRQVLLNLLSNAVKYSREGGSVEVSCQATADAVRVTVADEGPGIAAEHRALLFQPFQRLGAERTATEGTGIGLVIVKRLIEAMGGRVGVDSDPGVGSRFWVEVPRAASITEPAVVDVATPPAASPTPEDVRGRVVYVEDNPVNLAVMKHAFRRLPGVELLTAEDAETGLGIIQRRLPDLVLMDINLPGMSGLEALRMLKSDPRTMAIPVVAVSAAASPEAVKAGLDSGFAAYLTKPLSISGLLAQVREFLQAK